MLFLRLSFNPCFIGTYSFTKQTRRGIYITLYVLILVLLELILLRLPYIVLAVVYTQF